LNGTNLSNTDLSSTRIAIVNWRDPWHPQAGGAERYAWQMARALHDRGARVRFLTARARGQAKSARGQARSARGQARSACGQARREQRDGIEIVRLGGRFTVYPRVLLWLLAHRRSFDTVLDCQNGIPFFTPLVLPRRVPVLCVVHHVHTAQFGVHFGRLMAGLGRLLEGPAARRVYRRHACVAVSPSTVTAMRERLGWTGDIYLVPNGTARPVTGAVSRASAKNLVWVGRLVPHKRPELLIPVAERMQLRPQEDRQVLDVVGHGPAAGSLTAAVAGRGLDSAVRLRGFVEERAKQALVAGSLLHLNTSQGEGWGLCVLEAAALGVPTVAYDVEGLRDAVRDGETGWLVKDGEQLADVVDRALKELSEPGRRRAVASACRQWAARLDWGRSTARMAELIHASVQAGTSRARRPGTWIVAGLDGDVLAEGPVLDQLIASGAAVRRQATPMERLTGTGQLP
jgi:glycosyltransferase involved in cell wall biosynthesis